MTMYRVELRSGSVSFIDDQVLRYETDRPDPFGVLHWLDDNFTDAWVKIDKVEGGRKNTYPYLDNKGRIYYE